MSRQITVIMASALLSFYGLSLADSEISASAALQFMKNGGEASTHNIDNSFIRGELKVGIKPAENTGGLLHLRFESGLTEKEIKISNILRQAYWDLVLTNIGLRGGRWYSTYSPSNYFGRYLYGVNPLGSGSFCTNYSIVDGGQVSVELKQIKSVINIALLAQDSYFENIRTMIHLQTNPVAPLKLAAGTNLQVFPSENAQQRIVFNTSFEIIKNFTPFAEIAITDLSKTSDNLWVLAGIKIPAGKILDRLQLETEFKTNRLGEDTDADFAWMIILAKSLKNLNFYLNVGADPLGLSSRSAKDIGAYLRIESRF